MMQTLRPRTQQPSRHSSSQCQASGPSSTYSLHVEVGQPKHGQAGHLQAAMACFCACDDPKCIAYKAS